jgi:uracil-DNA glycosylase
MGTNWHHFLKNEAIQPYFSQLQLFLETQRRAYQVYPPVHRTYAALDLTPLESTRVVILGQDPYHGEGQANGLAFSVDDTVALPPSLRNIFTELRNDTGISWQGSGDLSSWARQGVLLLNTTLTVRAGEPASHRGHGWETFTNRVIETVNAETESVVFVLWGAHARSKKPLITNTSHAILETAHPSPLSAHRGFFGSKPFSQVNDFLASKNSPVINWQGSHCS